MMLHLDVELLGGCAKSLEYIQCGVTAVHVFRVEVALHELTGLFFDPGFNLVSDNRRGNRQTQTTGEMNTHHSAENCSKQTRRRAEHKPVV